MTLALDGVTFRWDGEELLLITATDQKRLTGSSAVKLLDFLMAIQQDLYTAEQARELPTWAHPSRHFVNGPAWIGSPRWKLLKNGNQVSHMLIWAFASVQDGERV